MSATACPARQRASKGYEECEDCANAASPVCSFCDQGDQYEPDDSALLDGDGHQLRLEAA